ncbi:FAS1-like dehydratase domain-containing protein [Streptomyces sp. NPDC055681]
MRPVTEEWLERFAVGAGDFNPLYKDPGYAASGRYRDLVASPRFLFSVNFDANASIWGHIPEAEVSMDDLTILYLGASIEWHRPPVWVGDRVRGIQTLTGVRRTSLRQISEALICTGTTEYVNSRGESAATVRSDMLRFPNPGRGVEASDQRAVRP